MDSKRLHAQIHVAVKQNGTCSNCDESCKYYDSTKFVDVMENIFDFLDDGTIKEIISVYADKGYEVVH